MLGCESQYAAQLVSKYGTTGGPSKTANGVEEAAPSSGDANIFVKAEQLMHARAAGMEEAGCLSVDPRKVGLP